MKPLVFLRIVGLSACAAVATLLLPSPAHARVRVSGLSQNRSRSLWQVDTFSGHLTGAQSPQNNMITSV